MSFFEDASLVLIPSGYKASKVYSVKPTDGTGDLTFTRSLDTATRVGPDGLIEKVITNTFTHSENFPNAVWEKTNVAITADTTIAPNGTLTADSMLSNTISNVDHMVRFTTSMAVSTEHTASFYAKQIVTRFAYIRDLTNNEASVFDLQDGVVSFQAASHTAKIVEDGSFYRVSITFQTPAVIINNLIDLGCTTSSTGITSVVPIGEGIAIWGAMLQTGVMTTYIPTTTAAVSVGMLANVPRLDYYDTTCPHLLLEPQRTNELLFSEQLNNAAWGLGSGVNITANTNVSPDGFTNADRANTTASSDVSVFQAGSTSGTTFTASVFAKKGTNKFVLLTINGTNNFNSRFQGVFNLDTGTLTSTNNSSTPLTNTSAKIEDYGNDWYRLSVTATFAASAQSFVTIQNTNVTPTLGGDNLDINNGTTGNAFYYGCQVEEGAFATSYIPTLAEAVTRSADEASKTGITALIGQTEGTLFMEVETIAGSPNFHTLFQVFGDGNNRIAFGQTPNSTNIFLFINGNGVNTLLAASTAAGSYKIALAYKSGSNALFINGVSAIDTAFAFTLTNALSQVFINNFVGTETGIFKNAQALLFKTRLTNAQLAELTA